MKIAVLIARGLLGLVFVVFGFNFFFNFIPQPPHQGIAGEFLGGMFKTGYMFPVIKIVEILCGAAILSGFFVPLALVVLMPINLNILLFHIFLEPQGSPMSIVFMALHLFLAWNYRESFKPLLAAK